MWAYIPPISLTLLDWNQLTFNLECISAHPIILVTFYYKTFFFDPESVMVTMATTTILNISNPTCTTTFLWSFISIQPNIYFWTFMVTMEMAAILKMSNPKCTYTNQRWKKFCKNFFFISPQNFYSLRV